MKKIWLITFSIIFLISNANAQVQRKTNTTQNVATNSDKKTKKLEMMKNLNLSKKQMGQLKESKHSMKEKKNAITNDQTLTEEQKQSKLKALHKEQKEKMNTILTPEQREKYKEEKKNAKMQKGNKTAGNNTGNTSK